MNRSFYSYSLIAVIALIVVSVSITVFFAVVSARQQATGFASTRLVGAHDTTLALLADRQALLEEGAISLSRERGLHGALLAFEPEKIASLLDKHRRLSADGQLAIVSDDGRVTAHSGSAGSFGNLDPRAAFASDNTTTLLINDVPHQIAFAPTDIGGETFWVGLAMPLNQAFLKRIQSLTGVEVELRLKAADAVSVASTRVEVDRDSHAVSLLVPLDSRGLDLELHYTLSNKVALGDFREFSLKLAATAFAVAAFTVLAVSLLLGAIAGRMVFRPLDAVRAAVSRMQQGIYTEDLLINSDDVFGRLARAFNQMQSDVAERESRIVHHAEYDALTGLTNRAVVADRLRVILGRAQRNGSTTAAMTIDIERFSDINGALGTETGDCVLKEVARRLASNTRATDLLARVGGDQFLIVVEDLEDRLTTQISEFLADTLERPINVDGRTISLRVRIGVAVFPNHCESAEGLRRLANVALITAKETGQRVVMYETGQDEKHLRELAVLNDLKKAIVEGQLTLHYQPKIDMKTRVVEHVEALVRWNHPQLGFIPPDEFIGLLERNNKIHTLTDWVLKTAVDQARRWVSRGFDLRIAVNISANDLLDIGLSQRIGTLLHHYAVEPNRITVEVTESAVMQDAEQASRVLATLRDLGIKVAIDDFGTGQTSLSLLKKLPLNELKIDKSFVQDLRADSGDGIIIKSTIDLGHNMGFLVVAEGVETTYAWNLLKSYGCDSVQGYLISKPLPVDQLEVWYLRQQARQVSRLDFRFVDGENADKAKKEPRESNLLEEILGDFSD